MTWKRPVTKAQASKCQACHAGNSSESSGRQKQGCSLWHLQKLGPLNPKLRSPSPTSSFQPRWAPTWHASSSQTTRGHHIIPDDLRLGSHIPSSQVASCHQEQRETLRLPANSTSIPWVDSSVTDSFCVVTVHLDFVPPVICSKLLTSHTKSPR